MEFSKEIVEFKENFDKTYYDFVQPLVKKYEFERIFKLILAIIISIVLIVLGVWVIIINKAEKSSLKAGAYLIFGGIITYSLIKKSFESKLKHKVMPEIQKCFGKIKWLDYSGYDGFFQEAGLFRNILGGDVHAYDDDVFKGSYKNVPIKIIETEYIAGSGKNSHTIFQGVLIELQMNKNFSGHTLLCNDSLLHKSPLKNLKWTKLEDVEFEKKYDVFTTDEIEARYILTPTFMEKIKDIKFAFNAKKMRCAFYKDKLVIAIFTKKDLFSIGSLLRPVADYKQFATLCEQFVSILALIDHLKLNEKAVL